MYLFDTNIFLEILLNQEHAEGCYKRIEDLNDNESGWMTSFSLHAIEAIIGKTKKSKILSKFLMTIETHPFLYVYATILEEELEISKIMNSKQLDFDDSLQYYVAKKKSLILVTLDKDFKKIKDIETVYPNKS